MEKNIPNLEALKKFIEEEQRNRTGLQSIITRAPSPIQQRLRILDQYKNYTMVSAWPELQLPKGAQIIIREKDDPTVAPFMVVLQDMTQAFQKSDIRKARRSLIDEQLNYDSVVLTEEEWNDLVERENANIDKIPAPYYHEALESFSILMEDDQILPFRPSQLSRIKYNGYDIIPLVDSLMNNGRGQTLLVCLGLVSVEADYIYQVALFWFGDIPKEYHDGAVDAICGYFYSQFAFHVCPERVIEVKPDDINPFEEEDESRERKRSSKPRQTSRTTIGRKIYIRDYPTSGKRRAIERRCRCWYVHGFMRTYKNGKQVWIKGYFKGPDRDNPNARQHTKDYVMA